MSVEPTLRHHRCSSSRITHNDLAAPCEQGWDGGGGGQGVVRNDTPHHLISGQKTLKAKHQLIKVALRA